MSNLKFLQKCRKKSYLEMTKGQHLANPLFYMLRPKRFELLTPWFVVDLLFLSVCFL